MLVLVACAFAAYLTSLWVLRRGAQIALVAAVAAAIQLAPLGAPLLLSTDAWSYWAYGWAAAHGDDPYRDPPQGDAGNPAVPWMGAAWRDTTTVYGPVFTAVSEPIALAARDSPDAAAWLFKTIAALATLAAALFAARRSSRPAFAAAVVGWSPLLAIHAAGGGHNDALLGALVAAALAAGGARRSTVASLLWPLAVFAKWIAAPVLAVAAAGRRSCGGALVSRADIVTGAAVVAVSCLLFGTGWLHGFAPLAANAARKTSFALPARLEQAGVPHLLATALGIAFIVGATGWLLRAAWRGAPRPGLTGCALLVGTPYLAVWYLGWVTPVVAGDDDKPALVVMLALSVYLLPQTLV